MGNFAISHLIPLSISFIPSRRQCLQDEPKYRPIFFAYLQKNSSIVVSYPSSFWGPAAIVRQGGDVLNRSDSQSRGLQRRDGRFPARPGAFNPDFDLANAASHRGGGGALGGLLGRKGRAFSRALKAGAAGRARTYSIAILIGDGN